MISDGCLPRSINQTADLTWWRPKSQLVERSLRRKGLYRKPQASSVALLRIPSTDELTSRRPDHVEDSSNVDTAAVCQRSLGYDYHYHSYSAWLLKPSLRDCSIWGSQALWPDHTLLSRSLEWCRRAYTESTRFDKIVPTMAALLGRSPNKKSKAITKRSMASIVSLEKQLADSAILNGGDHGSLIASSIWVQHESHLLVFGPLLSSRQLIEHQNLGIETLPIPQALHKDSGMHSHVFTTEISRVNDIALEATMRRTRGMSGQGTGRSWAPRTAGKTIDVQALEIRQDTARWPWEVERVS